MTIGNKLSRTTWINSSSETAKGEMHNGVMRGTYDRKSVKHVGEHCENKDHEYSYIINVKVSDCKIYARRGVFRLWICK